MKQKDKALSRLFPKNCPQKVGEGNIEYHIAKFSRPLYTQSMSIFPQKNAQLCIFCRCCMRVSSGAGRLTF